jgi:phosphate transport system permease protein
VAINAEALRGRPLVVSRARTARRILADRWASRLVVLGGIVIIASILAILFVIVAEVWPLFRPPWAERVGAVVPGAVPAGSDAVGVDEYRESAYSISPDGVMQFTPLRVAGSYPPVSVPDLHGARVTATDEFGGGHHVLGTSDGRIVPVAVTFSAEFRDGRRVLEPKAEIGSPGAIDPERARPILRLVGATTGGGPLAVAQVGPRDLILQAVVEKKALIGAPRREESLQTLPVEADGDVTALALDGRGDDLYVGTSRGELVRYDWRERDSPRRAETVSAASGTPITVLKFLNGDRTLVVGTAAGTVATWQLVTPPTGGEVRLARVNEFTAHPAAVVGASASRRDKGFVTADAGGGLYLHYGTSGTTLLRLQTAAGLRGVVFAPKADGVVTVDERGGLTHWAVHNPHPEVTLGTLFGRVW